MFYFFMQVAKVVAANRVAHDQLAAAVETGEAGAAPSQDAERQAYLRQKRRDLSVQTRERREASAAASQARPAESPTQAEDQGRQPARPPVTFGAPARRVDNTPAPLPNIALDEQGAPVARAQLAGGGSIPRRPPPPVQQPAQQLQAQQPAWLNNPAALNHRAEQIRNGAAPMVNNYVLPGRGPITKQEFAKLPPKQRGRVRTVKWQSRMNDPARGNQHNQAAFGCFHCHGDHPKSMCPDITCKYCRQKGHMQDWCYR